MAVKARQVFSNKIPVVNVLVPLQKDFTEVGCCSSYATVSNNHWKPAATKGPHQNSRNAVISAGISPVCEPLQ